MYKLKRGAGLLLAIIMAFSLIGCNGNETFSKKFDSDAKFYSVNRSVVAESGKYQLLWDDQSGTIALNNTESGIMWSTASVQNSDFPFDSVTNPRLKAPLIINYIEKDTYLDKMLNAYTNCMKDSEFSAELIDGGVKVTYYFTKEELAVAVSYSLNTDGFRISLDPKEIQENGNRVYSISIMPFMCAVSNDLSVQESTSKSYLFVPSGSGALVYPKTLGEGAGLVVSEPIYGNDLMNGETSLTNKADIKMPVFGAKVQDNAMFAIIEKGAESAEITVNVGSSTIGYSSIYPTFNVRGAYFCSLKVMNSINEGMVYSDELLKEKISVLYIPLEAENADYVGMAKVYQNYLVENSGLKKSQNDTLLNIKFIGGIMGKRFMFGIPYQALNILTDFDTVNQVVNNLSSKLDTKLNVNLLGFSKTGYTIGEIAGGYDYSNKFGSIEQISTLQSDNVSVFWGFETIKFADNGSGISKNKSALNVSKEKELFNEYDLVTSKKDKSSKAYYLVSRDLLGNIISSSVETAKKWNIKGIGLDSLSNQSYSDYTDNRYISKTHTKVQITGLLKGVSKNKLDISCSNANDYAAILATHIYDAPTVSTSYQFFDCDIPFYEIVFKGYKSMSTNSLNLVDNREKTLLKAIETGLGFTYTMIGEYDSTLIVSRDNLFYNSLCDDIVPVIISDMETHRKTLEMLQNQTIVNHQCITDAVRLTEYSNGTKVYVNFGDDDYVIGEGTIKAGSYLIEE